MENLKQIEFQNRKKTNVQFDFVKLEELFKRNDIDHSIEHLHKVGFYAILFITEGNGYHTIDFTDYQCSKGTIITIRKDQIHKFFRSDYLKGSLLLFTDEFLVSYLEKLEAQKVLQLFNELLGNPKLQLNETEFGDIHQIINRIKKEYLELNDNFSLGIIRSELHILVSMLFRIKSHSGKMDFEKKYLKEFIEFQKLVEQNEDKTIKVQDFANKLGASTKTLNNITKSIVNKSAKEFIDDIFINQIKRLLINTNLSIKEIAFESGFEETTNFYKYFKRQTKFTPEQFRVLY